MGCLFRLQNCRTSRASLVILGLSLVLSVPAKTCSSFEEQLPTDLVFTGKESLPGVPTLALLDATTLEVTPIYTDETVRELRVMSWSPQGDLMAVLSIDAEDNERGGFSAHLCTVTVSGMLQTCFAGRFPDYYGEAPSMIDYNYTVSWSSDGKKIYYVTENEHRTMRQLVEADTATGEILRTIYETPRVNEEHIPTLLAWEPELHFVAAGIGLSERSGVLTNLETGEQQDLAQIVAPWPYSAGSDSPDGFGFVCDRFSPQGTYLSAVNKDDGQLIIFDTTLHIDHIIDGFGIEDSTDGIIYCPAWTEDETAVYFAVRDLPDFTSVFTYSLQSGQLTELHQGEGIFYPPLEFSPDRSYFAFDLLLPAFGRIHVVYPDGEIRLFGEPFQYAQYPVWRPVSGQ
jgi:hypothetical protein